MISRAYIFGSLGKAAFHRQGEWFIMDADAPEDVRKWHPLDRNFFTLTSSTPETLYLEGEKKIGDLKKLLASETKKHQALTLALQLMDKSIDGAELNGAIASLLETYLSQKQVFEFIENRLLTTVVPNTFDPAGALEVCASLHLEKTTGLFRSLVAAADSIQTFYTVWQKSGKEHFVSPEAFDTAYSLLTANGIARKFVLSATNRDRLLWDSASVEATHLLQKHQLLQNAALFTRMRQELGHIFDVQFGEKPVMSQETEAKDEVEQMIEVYLEEYNRQRAVKRSRKDRYKLGRRKEDRKRVKGQVVFTDVSGLQAKVNNYSEKIIEAVHKDNPMRIEEYLRHLLKIQFKYSDPRHTCKSLCNMAIAVSEIGAIGLAKRLLNYAKLLNSEDVVVYNQYAEILRDEGDLAAAKAEYERIKKLFPSDDIAQKSYAEVLKAEGDLSAAKDEYERIKRVFPNDVFAQNGYAEVLKAEGNLPAAKLEYERIKRLYPNDVVAQVCYAEVLKAEGNLPAAKLEYERIKRLYPNDVVAQTGYAEVLKAEGNLSAAKAEYEVIKRLFPKNVVAQTGYAEVLKAEGNLPAAKAEYERIKRLFPNNVVAQKGYAGLLKTEGNLTAAKTEYQRIVFKYPHDQIARHALCCILLFLNEKIDFVIPLPENPKSEQDYYWHHFHFVHLIKAGEWDAAEKALEKGLATCQFYQTKMLYKRTLRYLALQKREYNAALAEINEAEETHPLDYALRAHLYAATGQKDLANKELEKVGQFQQFKVINNITNLLRARIELGEGQPFDELDAQLGEQEFEALLTFTIAA